MADNVAITAGTGTTIAADDIAGVLHQRVKISQGADGSATDVSSAAPLNVTLANTGANATPVVVDLGSNNDITGTVTANLGATDNAVLDSIDEATTATQTALETAGGLVVNLGSNNDVTVTGTVDLGATDNAVLDTIDGVLDTINAKLVTGTDIGDVTINNSTGAAAVNIQDGGNTITVDGTVTANLGSTDNTVLDNIDADTSAIQTAAEAIQAAVEGTLTVTGGGGGTEYTEDAAAAANPVGTTLQLIREDARAGSLTSADGDNVALRGNNKGEAYVKTTDSDALLATIDADTSDIHTNSDAMVTDLAAIETLLTTIEGNQLADSHNVTVDNASLTVDLGANNDVTVTGTVTADLGANNDVTVTSGTITANLGATDNQVLDDISADTGAIATDAAAIETLLTTIEGNQLADGHNVTIDNPGDVGGGTQYTEGDEDATITGTAMMMEVAADIVEPVQGTVADGLLVNLGSNNDISGTVTASLSATDNQVLDDISADTGAIATDAAAIEALLTTIDGDTSNLSVVGGGTEATAIRVTLANNSTGVVSVDDNGGALTVDGSVTADLGATDNAVLDAIAASTAAIETAVEGTLTVTGGGGGTEYTEDVATANPIVGTATMIERDDVLSTVTPIEGDNIGLRGTAEGALWTQDFNSDAILADTTAIKTSLETAGGQLVNLGANNDVTVTGSVTADLGANNDVTVTSGAVTATLSATDNAVLDQLELNQDSQTAILTTIDADTGGILADTAAIQTAVEIIDDAVAAEAAALGSGVLLQGDDGTDRKNVNVDATTGDVQVDVTNTVTVDLGANNDVTVTGSVTADLGANNDVTVTGTVDLGATDNAVLDTIDGVLDTINAKLVTGTDIGDVTINNSTGAAAVNIQDGGNTITVDGSVTVDMGANNDVTVTSGAVTATLSATDNQVLDDISADTGNIDTKLGTIDGAIIGPGEPTVDSYVHAAINLAAGTNQVIASSSASHQIWVYGIHFVTSAAGSVSYQDEDDTAVSGIMPFAANSGMSVAPSGNFSMPIWKLGTDKDLEVDVVTADIDGWIDYAIVNA